MHGVRIPGQRGSAIIDIFNLENHEIAQRSEVIQLIPAEAENANGMF